MTNSDPFSILTTILTILGVVLLGALFLPQPNTAPYPPDSANISYAASPNASWHLVNKGSTGILKVGQWFAVPITAPSKNATEMIVYADIVPTSIPMTMDPFGSNSFDAYLVNGQELQLLENGATVPGIESADLTIFGNHYTFITKRLPAGTYYLIIRNGSNPTSFVGIHYTFFSNRPPMQPSHHTKRNDNEFRNQLDFGSANYTVDVYY